MVWIAASWFPPRSLPAAGDPPHILLAVAFRDEASRLPDLLNALTALDYPRERLRICLIDDASTDEGSAIARSWVAANSHANLLSSSVNAGKAVSLNRALQTSNDSDVFAVFDADVRPRPDCLRKLAAPFADPRVFAVGGYTRPVNLDRNIVSAYAALEAWTHQLVNLAAKDRLNLNPPVCGGNCAYRIDALIRAGGFPPGALSEDTAVSIAMAYEGGVVRFVRDAICDHPATASLRFFLNQRQRWSHGMAAVIGQARGIEPVFVAFGYADRAAALAVALSVLAGWIPFAWLAVIVAPVVASTAAAILKGRPAVRELIVLAAGFPIMAAVDVGVSVFALANNMLGGRPAWAVRKEEVTASR